GVEYIHPERDGAAGRGRRGAHRRRAPDARGRATRAGHRRGARRLHEARRGGDQRVSTTIAGSRRERRLVVDVALMPDGPPTISVRSDPSSELTGHLAPLTGELKQLAAPAVSGSVHFLLEMVRPATG